jgi:plastocyanin
VGLLAVCIAAAAGCGGEQASLAPSALGENGRTAPLFSYHEGEPHDHEPAPADPAPPASDPAPPFEPVPPFEPQPGMPMPTDPAPVPAPVPTVVEIVGAFGVNAFRPNPLTLNLGDSIVWTNNDLLPHHIILGNELTVFAELRPGQSSPPMVLTTESVTYRCTLHPSMTGTIRVMAAADTPMPPDAAPMPGDPAPPSGGEPPPAADSEPPAAAPPNDGFQPPPNDYGYRRP